MKKVLLLAVLFANIHIILACDYIVNLHDSYGDGWNGNTITISVNGTTILNAITIVNGSDETFNFSANSGDIITITYNDDGSDSSENEITIVNNDLGVTLFSDGLNGTPTGGVFTIGDNCNLAPPSNDEPCGAFDLPMNGTCSPISENNEGATASNIENPSCGTFNNNSADVWFQTTVGSTGLLQITTTDITIDANMSIYTGDNCNDLTEIACTTSNSFFTEEYPMGTQIWIRIWNENNNWGNFEICAFEDPILSVDSGTYTPDELITEVLITGCLEANNVEYDGNSKAIGYFWNGENTVGMNSGLVLSTGAVTKLTSNTDSENSSYTTNNFNIENDLSSISADNEGSENMNDIAILEFDFIPSSETTEFKFVFASEEYPNWEHSMFNDVFAFFVSGPDINGTYTDNAINVALVPGTTDPITISTINGPVSEGGSGDNSEYFAEYTNNSIPNFNVGGYTFPLTAVMANLTPCETYHIKFCIADAGDGSLSSYVFFEESSFSSGGEVTMNSLSLVGDDSDLYEGCQNSYNFSRLDTSAVALQDSVLIELVISGTATEGIDYSEIPDTLYILPNEINVTLNYTAFFDNITEGTETIIFSLLNGCPCNLESTNDTIWLKDNSPLNSSITNANNTICKGEDIEIFTYVNPSIDPLLINYTWDAGTPQYTSSSINVSPLETTIYQVTISNVCHLQEVHSATVEVIPTIIPSFEFSSDTICKGEPVSVIFTGSTTPQAQFSWSDNDAYPPLLSTEGPHVTSWSSTGLKTVYLYVDDHGCTASSQESIYIKEYSNLLLSTTNTDMSCHNICDGTTTVLVGSSNSPFSYQWDNGQTSQTATNLCDGTYKVTVTDSYGCKDTTHVSLSRPMEMEYELSTDSASCYGSSDGAIYIQLNEGEAPYNYDWSNGVTSQNNTNIPSNQYSVTVTDNRGCQLTINDILVLQPNKIFSTVYGDHTINGEEWICLGEIETITCSATGGVEPYTLLWSTNETGSEITVQPNEATNYYVQVTDDRGCKGDSLRVKVNTYDKINLNTVLSNDSICKGESITIGTEGFGGNGHYTYILETNIDSITINNNYEYFPSESQDIIISVKDNCGSPYESDTLSIQVNPEPIISFSSDINSGCEPLKVNFHETVGEKGNRFKWQFSNKTDYSVTSLGSNPTLLFKHAGTYDIMLSVTNSFGCQASKRIPNYLVVYPKPIADFHTQKSTRTIIDRTFYFDNTSTEGYNYIWDFTDGTFDTRPNPAHTFPNVVGDYEVQLITSSLYSCTDTISKLIKVLDEYTLYAPTAFSPNRDHLNETFNIIGNGIDPENFLLTIYDRWGLVLFKTEDIEKGWDGKNESGNIVQTGAYKWLVQYKDSNGVSKEKSGIVKVIH